MKSRLSFVTNEECILNLAYRISEARKMRKLLQKFYL